MNEATNHVVRSCSAGSAPRRCSEGDVYQHYDSIDFEDEILRFTSEKKKKTMTVKDEEWRMSIKDQLEAELSRRVREALETPSSQQQRPPVVSQQQDDDRDLDTLNSHITMDELQLRERELTSNRRWKLIQTKRKIHDMFSRGSQHLHFGGAFDERYPNIEHYEELQSLRRDEYEELVRSYGGGDPNNDSSSHYGNRSHSQEFYDRLAIKVKNDYGNLTPTERLEFFYAFTKNGFREAMRTGRFPDGSQLEVLPNGKFKDKYGIIRDEHGPFWPADYGPLFSSPNHQKQTDRKCEPMVLPDKTGQDMVTAMAFHGGSHRYTFTRYATQLEEFINKYKAPPPDIKFWPYGPYWPDHHTGPILSTPRHSRRLPRQPEPLYDRRDDDDEKNITVDTNSLNNRYSGKWRGVMIIYDLEKSIRDYIPREVSEGLAPSLSFESRFECGNLRQARRIGAFEYELVLKTDLYTSRHTQWYYFRVQRAIPGVTYKFKIINLHKRDSLYNHGMRPLVYSEKKASVRNIGWERVGHHIVYTRNTSNLQCPLLARDRNYYTLEWQMEFQYSDDTHYLAHCYPYTFTDLRDDLDTLLADPERSKVMKRQVMCETRAGNSCFLITVTNFESDDHSKKKAIVVTARVHPGETNSSWMMRGLLEYVTGPSITAKQLRNQFIFKIVPMLNPDGVIVGNYRCSLAGRDLNRNYRHPRKESFPTVWYTKAMMEEVGKYNEIILYCDLHGHSRKHNVFMYGCNTAARGSLTDTQPDLTSEDYIMERLFPWLMSQKSPDKFWFRACKFQVKKCKESTGRVVMFKQMSINNSFTMEATFCGTTISREERRHFHTLDYQDMGHVFCEVTLEYQQIQNNKTRQSEVVIELTRAITQQILESRGLLPSSLPDFTTELGRQQIQAFPQDNLSGSEQIASAFIAMVTKDKSHLTSNPANQSADITADLSQPKDFTKMDVHQLLDTMSSQTIEGCAQLLEQLHIADTMGESDSSDSDSESEPEMKNVEPKSRRRKKKNKKKRQNQDDDSGEKSKVDCTQHAAIVGMPTTAERSKNDVGNGLPAIDDETQKRKKQGSSSGKVSRNSMRVTYPTFVNKYTSRSNGGIPCFSQERLMERNSKRMQEVQKQMEDVAQKRDSYFSGNNEDEAGSVSSSTENLNTGPFQRLKTQTDMRQSELRRQFSNILHCGSAPANAQGIRYMHAGPEAEGALLNMTPTHPSTRVVNDSSESEEDVVDEPHSRVPLTAMRSPYSQNLNQSLNATLPSQPSMLHPLNRRLGRLPALSHKMSTESHCSIPRRHSIASNMVVTPMMHRQDKPDGVATVDTGHVTRPAAQKRHGLHTELATEVIPAQQGSALGLMSREYTDLLMQRLQNHKSQNNGNHGNITSMAAATKPLATSGSRHSTCE